MAPNSGALRKHGLKRVAIGITVQPQNIAFPTVASCCLRRSVGSTATPASMACGYGSPASGSPSARR